MQGEEGGEIKNRYLIPTSEVSLTNPCAARWLTRAKLPMRLTAHTPCFPPEAGSWPRHARHDPPAPVRQSGDGLHLQARGIERDAGGNDW